MIIGLSIFLLLSPFFTFLCPHSFSRIGAVGREGLFILLILVSVIQFFFKKVKFGKTQIIIFMMVLIELLYWIISQGSLTNIILYISGPLLFLTLSLLNIKRIKIKLNILTFIITLFVILNLVLYRYQVFLVAASRVDPIDVQRHLYRNGEARLFGITFMPTIMAFICVLCLIFNKKKIIQIISVITWYLTGARLFIPGYCFVLYCKLKRKYRIYLFFFFIIFSVLLSVLIIMNSDDSIKKHLEDLFIRGPSLMIENFYGCGLRKEIGLESDVYLYFIRFGLWGGGLYIICFVSIIRSYIKNNVYKDPIIRKGISLVIIYFIGSFFLPLTLQRPLSNLFWLFEGLVFSYRRQICKKIQ